MLGHRDADQFGAPVDVDISIDAAPAPFVSEDSVYRYIIGLLDSAQTDLVRADTFPFPFSIPPGFSAAASNALDFSKPAKFIAFNRALAAKANVLRATDGTACKGNAAACYNAALSALSGSFIGASFTSAALQAGAYFDFSSGQGDVTNGLSEPLNALTFFAFLGSFFGCSTRAITNGNAAACGMRESRSAPASACSSSSMSCRGSKPRASKGAAYRRPISCGSPTSPIIRPPTRTRTR